jgi:hypothetical protein
LSLTAMRHFFYPRHFLLLACVSVVAAILTQRHFLNDLSIAFASYGALHALALTLSLRRHHAIWRKSLFIVLAAALSVMTLRVGLWGVQFFALPAGHLGFFGVIGICAAIGAAAYGVLIRQSGFYALPLAALAMISAGCMLATYAAEFTLGYFHSLGRWWLTQPWWYAFSGGICCCDLLWRGAGLRHHPN